MKTDGRGSGAARASPPLLYGYVKTEGEVRSLRQRTESNKNSNTYIWTFCVERYDSLGNRLPPVPVEMRGRSIRGVINEGDRVWVRGRAKRGVVRANKVKNLTTGAIVQAQKIVLSWLHLADIVFVIIIIVIIASVL
jgi:hypothetical protein